MLTITVGDPAIPWTRLNPQSDSKRVVLHQGGSQRVIGTTEEIIEWIEFGGKPALWRTQTLETDLWPSRTGITVVERATFAPLAHREHSGEQIVSIEYSGTVVRGSRQLPSGQGVPIQAVLPGPAFELHSVEMILRLLPLGEGFAARLPAYSAHREGLFWVALRATGQERVDAGGGRAVDAWVVEVDFGPTRQTYWVGGEPPELLRQSSLLEDGAVLAFVR